MTRERAIVRRAAAGVRSKAAKAWLKDDPRGYWEKRAGDLITYCAERWPDLSAQVVDDEVVARLAYESCSALAQSLR